MSKKPTSPEVKAMFQRMIALGDAIHQLGQIPEGHLYARAMGQMTLLEFKLAIGLMIKERIIKREHDVLHWIG